MDKKKLTYYLAIVAAVIMLVADRITKYYVVKAEPRDITFIPGILNFNYVQNSGAAFGIFENCKWFLIGITIVVMIIAICLIMKKTYRTPLIFWAVMLIISGGLGNLYDRIFNKGIVVDFLETKFMNFPVFNVADCAVTIGVVLLLIYFIKDVIDEVKRKNSDRADDGNESIELLNEEKDDDEQN